MAELTVLGVGNILMRDDGVGVRLMEAARDARAWDGRVEFIDGGAGGLNLLNIVERASRLIVLDAADMRLPTGAGQVPRMEQVAEDGASGRLSLHEMPIIETLRLCRQFLRCPPTMVFAVQPADVGHGRDLSPVLQAAMENLTHQVVDLIGRELSQPEQSVVSQDTSCTSTA